MRAGVLTWRLGPWTAAALAAVVAVGFLLLTRQEEYIDFHVYHLGGRTVLDGGPLYDVSYLTRRSRRLLFTYSPFAAGLMTPLALVPFGVALWVWTIGSVTAWGLSVWRAAPSLRHPVLFVGVLVASVWWFMPLVRDLKVGQINTFLVLAILVDLASTRLGRARGALTGIAAGIKLTPLVFLPFLLLTRQFRAAAMMTAGFLGSIAVGALVLPGPTWNYWTGLAWDSRRVGDVTYVSNQSVQGALSRFGLTGSTLTGSWLAVAGLLGLVCLLLAARQYRRGEPALAVATMALASLFCSPISWSHHWIWIGPIILIALEMRRWRDPVGWLALAAYFWAPIWNVPREHRLELRWTPWQHVQGEFYLLAGLLVLGWFGWLSLRRSSSPTAPEPVLERPPQPA